MAEFASWDVAWWTDLLLGPSMRGTWAIWWVRGIYCGIHKAMKVSYIIAPDELATRQLKRSHLVRLEQDKFADRWGNTTRADLEMSSSMYTLEKGYPDPSQGPPLVCA